MFQHHTSGYISKGNKSLSQRNLCTLFIAASSTVAKIWKQPKCPLTDEWVKKILYYMNVLFCILYVIYICVCMYHSALKKGKS